MMENKAFGGMSFHTVPKTVKISDCNLPSMNPTEGSSLPVIPQISSNDVGSRVVPLLYIQGPRAPMQVAAHHFPGTSTTISHQKLTTRPVLRPACPQSSSAARPAYPQSPTRPACPQSSSATRPTCTQSSIRPACPQTSSATRSACPQKSSATRPACPQSSSSTRPVCPQLSATRLACPQLSSVPFNPHATATTFTQPTPVQTYSQTCLMPSVSCSQSTLLPTNTQTSSNSKCSNPIIVPTCSQGALIPPTQSPLITTHTRPVFVSSVTRPTLIPSLVPSNAQILPPLVPKPPSSSTNVGPSSKANITQQHSSQLPTSQRIMIQPPNASTVKNQSYAYVGTLLRQDVNTIDNNAQKILLANLPLPLPGPTGSSSTSQQTKMTSLILPVTIPTQVSPGKTNVINLKIANRHILPDGKASVTVLRERPICPQPPPLQPFSKPPKLVSISSGQVFDDQQLLLHRDQSQVASGVNNMKKVPKDKCNQVKKSSSLLSEQEATKKSCNLPSEKGDVKKCPSVTEEQSEAKNGHQILPEQIELKKNLNNLPDEKSKQHQDLNRCLKEAVDAIFAPGACSDKKKNGEEDITLIKVPNPQLRSPNKQKRKQKQLPIDDVKLEIIKPEMKAHRSVPKCDGSNTNSDKARAGTSATDKKLRLHSVIADSKKEVKKDMKPIFQQSVSSTTSEKKVRFNLTESVVIIEKYKPAILNKRTSKKSKIKVEPSKYAENDINTKTCQDSNSKIDQESNRNICQENNAKNSQDNKTHRKSEEVCKESIDKIHETFRVKTDLENTETCKESNVKIKPENIETYQECSETSMGRVGSLRVNNTESSHKKHLKNDVKESEVKIKQDVNTLTDEDSTNQKLDMVSKINPQDIDPMKILEWEDGIGKLPGSELKFRVNEFNIIELVDDDEYADLLLENKNKTASSVGVRSSRVIDLDLRYTEAPAEKIRSSRQTKAAYNAVKDRKPLKERTTSKSGMRKRNISTKSIGNTDEFYHCTICGYNGLAVEFYRTSFCSKVCFSKKSPEIKRTLVLELHASRKKLKSFLTREKAELELELKKYEEQNPEPRSHRRDPDRFNVDGILRPPSSKKKKLPWQRGAGGFCWPKYLEYCKAKVAPVKLFKEPFPYGKNGFKIGMRMEGIDPVHPAYFCVLNVADIQGYRLRLNFDGYSDMYDIWVNANSKDIFPVGWCARNGHFLQPPKNYKNPVFNWNTYLRQCRVRAAPRHLFLGHSEISVPPSGFQVGMKLEAVDRKNSYLVCVATVADIMDNRILVHFDSWDDIYDYWADPSSPYIHPVGWCKENGHILTPPLEYNPPESFSWEHYLKETNSQATPAEAFKQRPLCEFRPGMKLEVVDRWVPRLIHVATVEDASEHQFKIKFDGWRDSYSYWVDDDSTDIHPVGWCKKTHHSLQLPLTPVDYERVTECSTSGCRGLGHIKGPKYKYHHTASTCPYSLENLHRDNLMSDRLYSEKGEKVELPSPDSKHQQKSDVVRSTAKLKLILPDIQGVLEDSPSKDDDEDNIARRLRKRTIENTGQIHRPSKIRRLDERKNSDSSIEALPNDRKRKSCRTVQEVKRNLKEEFTKDIMSEKMKPETRQSSSRASKQRRLESSKGASLSDDPDWEVEEDSDNHTSTKRKASIFSVTDVSENETEDFIKEEPAEYEEDHTDCFFEDCDLSIKERLCCEAQDPLLPVKKTCFDQHHFTLCGRVHDAVVNPKHEPELLNLDKYLTWAKHYEYLDFYTAHVDLEDFANWSPSEVAQFVSSIPGCEEKAEIFVEQEIDGDVFLLLSLVDLVQRIGLKLGPAMKLYNSINMIRVKTLQKD